MTEEGVPQFEQRNSDLAPPAASLGRRGGAEPIVELRQRIGPQPVRVQFTRPIVPSEVGNGHFELVPEEGIEPPTKGL